MRRSWPLLLLLLGAACKVDEPKPKPTQASAPSVPAAKAPQPIDAALPDVDAAPLWRSDADRWRGLHDLLYCRREQLDRLASPLLGEAVPVADERSNPGWFLFHLADGCREQLSAAAEDRRLTAVVRGALTEWLGAVVALDPAAQALGTYYSERDFVDDDLAQARQSWPELRRLAAAMQQALVDFSRIGLPALRVELLEGGDPSGRGGLNVALDVLGELVGAEPLDLPRFQVAAADFRTRYAAAPVETRRLARPVFEALNRLAVPAEGGDTPVVIDAAGLRLPIFEAMFRIAPSRPPQVDP